MADYSGSSGESMSSDSSLDYDETRSDSDISVSISREDSALTTTTTPTKSSTTPSSQEDEPPHEERNENNKHPLLYCYLVTRYPKTSFGELFLKTEEKQST